MRNTLAPVVSTKSFDIDIGVIYTHRASFY